MMVKWNYLNWEEMVERAITFFKKIGHGQKVVLMHHGDCDGVVSALYIAETVKEIRGRYPDEILWVSTKSYKLKNEKALIDHLAPDVLLVTDLDLGKEPETLKHWADVIDNVFIYDHHNIDGSYKDAIPRSIEYLNARMLGIPRIWHPAAYFGYSLFKHFSKNDYPWLAALGLRGDHAFDEYEELKNEIRDKFPELLKEIENEDYKNLLEKLVYFVNAGFFHNPNGEDNISFKVLQKAMKKNDYTFVYSNEEEAASLFSKRQELKSDIEKIYDGAKDEAKIYEDIPLLVYRINTPHYILGVIASRLKDDHPDKIIYIFNQFDDEISGEIRQGEKIDVNLIKLLLGIGENFKYISVGGHPRAAGCLFPASKYDEYLRLLEGRIHEFI